MKILLLLLSLAVNLCLWSALNDSRKSLAQTQSELEGAREREKRAMEIAGRARVLVDNPRQGSPSGAPPQRHWMEERLETAGKSLDTSANAADRLAGPGRSRPRR